MGNPQSQSLSNSIENATIAKQLARDQRNVRKIKRVLVIGTEGSGKSTILRQWRGICGKGFDRKERHRFVIHIHTQCITQMQLALEALEKYTNKHELSGSALKAKAFISNINHTPYRLNDEAVSALKCLWNEPVIQKMYEMRNITKIEESSAYFWNKLDVLHSPNYVPDEADILLVRYRNTGVTEEIYEMPDGKGRISFIDIGGQKSKIKKWINCFDSVTAVLFVASLSCYDTDLDSLVPGYIDSICDIYDIPDVLISLIKQFCMKPNVMTDQLELFDYICNCKALRETSNILFLNKKDLFADKITKFPLTDCPSFFHYSGEPHSFDETTKYIRKAFTSLNNIPHRKNIFTHLTCATDQDNLYKVFADVQHIVNEASLIQAGLMDWDDNYRYEGLEDGDRSELACYVRETFGNSNKQKVC